MTYFPTRSYISVTDFSTAQPIGAAGLGVPESLDANQILATRGDTNLIQYNGTSFSTISEILYHMEWDFSFSRIGAGNPTVLRCFLALDTGGGFNEIQGTAAFCSTSNQIEMVSLHGFHDGVLNPGESLDMFAERFAGITNHSVEAFASRAGFQHAAFEEA